MDGFSVAPAKTSASGELVLSFRVLTILDISSHICRLACFFHGFVHQQHDHNAHINHLEM